MGYICWRMPSFVANPLSFISPRSVTEIANAYAVFQANSYPDILFRQPFLNAHPLPPQRTIFLYCA